MQHAERLLNQHGGAIRLVHGAENGQACWVYVQLALESLAEYKKAVRAGSGNLNDYGTILLRGWGNHPPASAIEHMQQHYGFETVLPS